MFFREEWRSRSHLVSGAALIAILFLTHCTVDTSKKPQREFYSIQVFDCEFPIPRDYVLRTSTRKSFRFVQQFESGSGIINVKFDPPEWGTEKGIEIVEKRRIGKLEVIKYRFTREYFGDDIGGPPIDVAVVDNKKVFVVIMGKDAGLMDFMLKECQKTMEKDWEKDTGP